MQTYGQILDALGDPTRRAILDALRRGPRPVGELATRLPVSRPAVSQHLKILKEAGLVTDRRNGTQRLYQLDAAGLAGLRAYLEAYWSAALGNLKVAVERDHRIRRRTK
ncbi:MAG: winged helix-turn-helix transcriptional regulator [Candidatus Eremiobacteraeota bacterium]|nr:winged helix-turn-helix transcriptional regulator [Candidatus Eremiobacteraeota bacterium]MBV8365887.1 winged helix-turn-helix transcriptional regulator [Candidatus Eremiobacteraeota bacterium]